MSLGASQGSSREGRFDVARWADSIDVESLFLSAITIFELEIGVLQIERRDEGQGAMLRTWLDTLVLPEFKGRIFPVRTVVAQRCARLHVPNPRLRTRRSDCCDGSGAWDDGRDPERGRFPSDGCFSPEIRWKPAKAERSLSVLCGRRCVRHRLGWSAQLWGRRLQQIGEEIRSTSRVRKSGSSLRSQSPRRRENLGYCCFELVKDERAAGAPFPVSVNAPVFRASP